MSTLISASEITVRYGDRAVLDSKDRSANCFTRTNKGMELSVLPVRTSGD